MKPALWKVEVLHESGVWTLLNIREYATEAALDGMNLFGRALFRVLPC